MIIETLYCLSLKTKGLTTWYPPDWFQGKKTALKRVSLTAKYTVVCWGKISTSTKDSCPNQITSKVKWSTLNHIFALVENASNRQTKDLERVQKQRARVWGSHPSGKNFTPALRFTRLVPWSLVDEVDKRTGYEITRLAKGGVFREKHNTVQELIAHLYILFAFTWLLGPIESDVTLNCWDSHEVPSG